MNQKFHLAKNKSSKSTLLTQLELNLASIEKCQSLRHLILNFVIHVTHTIKWSSSPGDST
jgi:hypothetical protein